MNNFHKRSSKNLATLLVLITMLLINGCASNYHGTTWTSDQHHTNDFTNLMVMGLANSVSVRSDTEQEIVFVARKNKLQASPSISMFPPELGKPFEDVERVKSRLRDKGFDAILTISLIDVRAERYKEATVEYEPKFYYNQFGNYYYRTYDLVYKPAYFEKETNYYIETNLYELKEGKLIWSGRSTTFEPNEYGNYLPIYAKRLFKELLKP